MKRKNGVIFAMAVVCIVTAIQSGVVFEDPFDNKNNWVKATGTCTDVIQSGQYIITATALSEFKHTQSLQTFTYSMDMKIESNYAEPNGILFCLASNMTGYLFSLSNKQYNFGKWIVQGGGVSYSNIKSDFNSFISTTPGTSNILKVSKKGSDISFFCNNAFLEKISDATYTQGDIGFAVGTNQKVAFNHARVLDTAEVGKYKTWFFDYFQDNDLLGWTRLPVNGWGSNVKSESGVMKVQADSQTIYYSNGAYKDLPCTTIVDYKSGKTDAFYGIIFLQITTTSATGYYYLINAGKQYTVFSGNGTVKSDSRIHGTRDTLIVTADYDFLVNGFVLDNTTFTGGLDFNAVGICVYNPGVTIHFDDYRAGINDGTPIINPIHLGPYTKNKPNYLLGDVGLIYDIRGRKVASFDAGYKAKLKELGAGHYYIVVPNGNQKHIIRQAIIKTQ